MAVLVKPDGLLGTAYTTGIKPFRHLIVSRALRELGREGRARAADQTPEQAELRSSIPNLGSGKFST
jgi:Protein of unknown function (DUF2867)